MSTTVNPAAMQNVYYNCNPTPHSEKAYQKEDPAPPIATRGTVVGPSGTVVVLDTRIYNKPPYLTAEYAVHSSPAGHEIHRGSGVEPFKDVITGLTPGSSVYIQPRTIGTMAKILTPEQMAAGGFTL